MLWFVYAIFCAIFMSLAEIFQKRGLIKEHSLDFVAARSFFGFIALIVIIPFIDWKLSFRAIVLAYFVSIIFVVADFYRARAYRHMDISSAAPLYNLIPAVVAFLSFFFLGETVTFKQMIGILILVAGAYVLEVDHNTHSLIDPIKKILKSKYIHIILFVLFLLGVGALFEKYVIDNFLSPFQFLVLFFLFLTLNYFIIDLFKGGFKTIFHNFKEAKIDAFFSGFFWVLEILFYFLSLQLQMVSLVMPIKRLHSVFTTIGGGTIFKDKGLYLKAGASMIMFLGVLLIVT